MLLQQQCLSPHKLTPTTISPTFHQQHRDGNSNPLYCVFNQSRRRRRRTAIRGVERESSEFELDKEKAREALRKLDQQLQDLSSRETNQPRKRMVSSSKLGKPHLLILCDFVFSPFTALVSNLNLFGMRGS
ncbi:hypothetical protein Syun_017488 [Stephania yunnanensis]|uniref:Uncharacterized protein n=1 Tax=Stephania yunnanensis TaxID=152371 RepID=A0AAP0J713_9MAGN